MKSTLLIFFAFFLMLSAMIVKQKDQSVDRTKVVRQKPAAVSEKHELSVAWMDHN